MSTTVLYTPEVLGLAIDLANYPWDEALPLQGEARSRSCGSTIRLALELDGAGRIARIAVRSSACAIGQASAAIFAAGAAGMTAGQIREGADAIAHWLAEGATPPSWPGLAAIVPAREYPARHGAILLAWQAARELLGEGRNEPGGDDAA